MDYITTELKGVIGEKYASPRGSVSYSMPFTDIKADAEYYDAVLLAYAKGVTKGTGAAAFSPSNGCTRAEIVTMLYRSAGSPEVSKDTVNPFSDVKAGSYYYDAVLWAVEKGITCGTSETTFSPDETCTRAQVVTFLWRLKDSPEVHEWCDFSDVPQFDCYYTMAVNWATANKITQGVGNGLFAPDGTCTRAQVVTILLRAQ